MTKVYIVADNNLTDGECGHIIGVASEYEIAVGLKRRYIEMHERWDRRRNCCREGKENRVSFPVRYPHNIEILEKELV